MKKQKITMAVKFNTLKSIKQALIGTNIVFPAVYLLFSAEVCSGGILKNQLSSQISHTAPVSLAAKPVAQLNTIEGLEDTDPNRYALDLFHRDQSVIPVQIRKPDEHMDGFNHTDVPATTIQKDRPPKLKPFSQATQTKATDPEISDKEKRIQTTCLYMLEKAYCRNIYGKDPASKSRMNAIRWRSPTQYIIELRHFFIKASLEALEGAYGYRKIDAVKWFFKQSVQDIVNQYDRSILDLVIKEVEENQERYKKIVGLEKNQKKYSIVVLVEELKTLVA